MLARGVVSHRSKLEQQGNEVVVSLRPRCMGYERVDAAVGHSAQHLSHRAEPLLWAGHKPGGATYATDIEHAAEQSGAQLRQLGHYFDRSERAGRRPVAARFTAV